MIRDRPFELINKAPDTYGGAPTNDEWMKTFELHVTYTHELCGIEIVTLRDDIPANIFAIFFISKPRLDTP
jgi:hypothetical protein